MSKKGIIYIGVTVIILLLIAAISAYNNEEEAKRREARLKYEFYSYRPYRSESGGSQPQTTTPQTTAPRYVPRPQEDDDLTGYTTPEDLYYDHPDEFYDYEDAEDYWFEHDY